MQRTVLLVLGMLGWATAGLAGPWTLTTADFQEKTGDLGTVFNTGLTLLEEGKEPAMFPWTTVVEMRQSDVPAAASEVPFLLVMRDGRRIPGTPAKVAEDTLTWQNTAIGELTVPLELVQGWAKTGVALPETDGKQDVIILENRDELRGVLEGGEGGVQVQQGVDAVPWNNLRAVVLAQTGGTTVPAGAGRFWVKMNDGTILQADSLETQGNLMKVLLGAQQVIRVPLRSIQQIQSRKGKVVFLAWQTPAEVKHTPYLKLSAEAAEPGLRVLDELMVGNRSYSNVVQLRPQMVAQYIAPANGQLHLRYAAANPGELTDMTLRIRVGGKVVHDASGIRSGRPGEAIEQAVNKGDAVQVELNYGANFDAQDRLLLLEAAFVVKGESETAKDR